MKKINQPLILFMLSLVLFSGCMNYDKKIYGAWDFNKEKSTDIVTWRYRMPQLVINKEGEFKVSLVFHWLESNKKIAMTDTINFVPGAGPVSIPVKKQFWLENWYMGVLQKVGTDKIVSGEWLKQDRVLKIKEEKTVETSQGDSQITSLFTYELDRKGDVLTVTEERSSRPTQVILVFDRIMPEE